MMIDHLIYLHFIHIQCECRMILLIFNGKKCIMAKKYILSITMIGCQIEKWHRYIRHWSLLKFSSYLQLKLVRIRRMILLKREVT